MRTFFLNPLLLACVLVYALAMGGVDFVANRIVADFGPIGGVATIAAMYAAARWYEWHNRQ